MSEPDRIWVPLPAELAECGCPRASAGRHSTSCMMARQHDAIRLQDRADYVEGARFQAVSWDYPLRMSATVHVTLEIDPVEYIARHRDEYEALELERGFADWEKPLVFISRKLEEDIGETGRLGFGWPRYESRVESYVDHDTDEYPKWTPEATEALHQALGPRVDPNQGVLGE